MDATGIASGCRPALAPCGHVSALPQVVGAQRGPVPDQPQVAERVGEAALPVDPPWCLVITDLVGAAVGSGRHGAVDEAVRVIDEHRSNAENCRVSLA